MFTNRENQQKPNKDLINNFQATYSDVVRPGADPDSSARLGKDGAAGDAADAVRITPSLDDSSLPPTSIRKHNDHESNAANMFSRHPAGDLLTPSSRMNVLFDETLFDQFTNSSPGASAQGSYNDPFDGQYSSHLPETPGSYLKNMSFSPEGFKFPREEYGDTISLGEVDKRENQVPKLDKGASSSIDDPGVHNNEKFRYCVMLHAPTAMIKDQKEVPVTYLNKGQTYILSIADSVPPPAGSRPARYRTSVRIIFDEEAQSIDPAACWQLWKQVRGSKEAKERHSDVQAVDCLDPAEGEAGHPRNQLQLERMSVDGFSCTWTADILTGVRECNIGVRFNFLSTDFTHSKGVKGSSVRLCAKTEMIKSDVEDAGVDTDSEMCYCKVKLFRDHGAERKLHSDISQTEKSIKKLQRETAMSEAGEDDQLGKRKRGSLSSVARSANHAMTEGEQRQAQIYRDAELHILGDSLTSNLPMTILTQRAEPKDDPDQYPVRLPAGSQSPPKSHASPQNTDSTTPSNAASTNPSSPATNITEPSRVSSNPAPEHDSPQNPFKVPPLPAKLSKRSHSGSAACFYVRFHHDWKRQDYYHRAVYLKERTVHDLTVQICRKQNMNPDSVSRVLQVNPGGLKIMIDDDVVQQLPDGQDMMVEVCETSKPKGTASEVEIILSF